MVQQVPNRIGTAWTDFLLVCKNSTGTYPELGDQSTTDLKPGLVQGFNFNVARDSVAGISALPWHPRRSHGLHCCCLRPFLKAVSQRRPTEDVHYQIQLQSPFPQSRFVPYHGTVPLHSV